jgi:hypothetical protein
MIIDETKLKQRYKKLNDTGKKYGKSPIEYQDLKNILDESIKNGFKCCYCDRNLTQKSIIKYYPDVYSFDHIISFSNNGDNSPNNICVCCHECNIIKSTTDEKSFKSYIKTLSPEERFRFLKSSFKGRLANKIDRVETINNYNLTKSQSLSPLNSK